MIGNRRSSKIIALAQEVVARVWRIRVVLMLALPYLVLLGWLFSADSDSDVRPAEVYTVPEQPVWKKPDAEHRFGTTGGGADLYRLSRVAMANSVAVSVISSGLGVSLSFLVVMLFAFSPGENRFRLLKVMARAGFLLPPMMLIVILTGGAGGSLVVAMMAMSGAIAFMLAPVVAGWFEEGEGGRDILAGYALGLTRRDIVKSRIIPIVVRRLLGVFAQLLPVVVLAEMALSFMGFTGDRISCGAMVAYGRELIIEAPWMAAYPGILATVVVGALAALGALVAGVLRTGRYPRFL